MLPHWTQAYINLDGDEFHYTRTGDGDKPPVLLLHGLSDNGLCWLSVARELEANYDVIMPDARGHGKSARVLPGEQIDNADDVADLITALRLQTPIVAGHSMGGVAATELGARYPDLVGALILEDPAWIDPAEPVVTVQENPFFAWLMDLEGVSVDEIVAMGKAFSPTWPEVEFPTWAESKRQLDTNVLSAVNVRKPWREFVAALTVPTLLITAEVALGAIVSPAMAQEAAALAPLIQVARIPDAGHNIRRENYPAFMQAVQAFLNQLHKDSE